MSKPTGAYTWDQILQAARQANVNYGQFMPQGWIDYLNEALREMPSQPSQSPVSREEECIKSFELRPDTLKAIEGMSTRMHNRRNRK